MSSVKVERFYSCDSEKEDTAQGRLLHVDYPEKKALKENIRTKKRQSNKVIATK